MKSEVKNEGNRKISSTTTKTTVAINKRSSQTVITSSTGGSPGAGPRFGAGPLISGISGGSPGAGPRFGTGSSISGISSLSSISGGPGINEEEFQFDDRFANFNEIIENNRQSSIQRFNDCAQSFLEKPTDPKFFLAKQDAEIERVLAPNFFLAKPDAEIERVLAQATQNFQKLVEQNRDEFVKSFPKLKNFRPDVQSNFFSSPDGSTKVWFSESRQFLTTCKGPGGKEITRAFLEYRGPQGYQIKIESFK